MKRYLTTLILTILSLGIQSQDTVALRTVVIQDSVVSQLQSGYDLRLKPETQRVTADRSLDNFLSRMTSIRFKNYGPGLSSTPTFRSGDANHTQVLWNGFTLNSPMHGGADFSTLPISQFNRINVHSGNSSNLYTNGALGGSILLQQSAGSSEDGLFLEASYGSFGNFGGSFNYQDEFSTKNSKTSILFTSDLLRLENRYKYENNALPESPEELMVGSEFSRINMSANVLTKLKSSDIQFIYWFSGSDRQIPQPLNYFSSNSQNQKDVAHRMLVGLDKRFKNSAKLSVKLFYENSLNSFVDTLWQFENNNQYQIILSQLCYVQRLLPRVKLNVRLNPSWSEATTESYSKSHDALSLNGTMLLEGFWMKHNQLVSEVGARLNSFAGDAAVTPFGGLTYYVLPKKLGIFASYSQNVRFPTFNELYWVPGGNLDLKPEHSSMIEGGVKFKQKDIRVQALVFDGTYSDRIRWLQSDSWIYSPINIDKSNSKGVELNYSQKYAMNKGSIFWSLNTNWTQAEWLTDSSSFDLSFVPNLAGGVNMGVVVSNFSAHYSHQYTSKRYTLSDESDHLPDYQIGNISVGYKILNIEDSHVLDLRFEVNNVWNENYQIMPWRPMPGREFIFTIRYVL